MPSIYKRKTDRQSWSDDAMARALDELRTGRCGFLKAAKRYGVPKSTLERRFKNKNKDATGNSKLLGSRKLTFPFELEQQLVDYIKNMEEMMYGLTTKSVRSLAYQLAERNNIKHYFNNESQMAGWHWLRSFLARNRLSLRSPEATSAARARGFNKKAVESFFNMIEPLQEEKQFPPSKIFNVDETGITTVQGRPSKVVALRGRKQVGTLTSAERGELATAVICMSASGVFIPPMIIMPRVRQRPEYANGTPPDTLVICHKSGWMQLDLFEQWFDHFLTHTQASIDNPILLILDGHKTHTQNISVIDKARTHGVTIVCLPPHTSHHLQPLDVSFMGPLSTFYSQEVEIWLRNHPGRCISLTELGSLFGKSYLRASTPLNAINGFKKTGLYPLDRTVFTDDMFAAALPTDEEPTQDRTEDSNQEVHNVAPPPDNGNDDEDFNYQVREITPEKQIIRRSPPAKSWPVEVDDLPSTSRTTSSKLISPEVIAPYPKAPRDIPSRKKPGKRGKASILTSTPYKEELNRSLNEKNRKMGAKKVKSNITSETVRGKSSKNNTKGKNKEQRKTVVKNNTNISSSDSEGDAECLSCGDTFSKDRAGEGWIKCQKCGKWAHDACAVIDSDDDDDFTCQFCLYA